MVSNDAVLDGKISQLLLLNDAEYKVKYDAKEAAESKVKEIDKDTVDQQILNEQASKTEQDFFDYKRDKTLEVKERIMGAVKLHIKGNWTRLRQEIKGILAEIDEYQRKNKNEKATRLSRQFSDALVDIFRKEINRQRNEVNTKVVCEADLKYMVKYETTEFIKSFNQIVYNAILQHCEFQNNVLTETLKGQIENVKSDASEHFDKFNDQMSTELDQATAFVSMIFTSLFRVVKDDLVNKSGVNEDNIDAVITKAQVMHKVQKMFE